MFDHVGVRKDSLLKDIRLIDEKEENSDLSEDDRAACQVLKEDYERVLCLWKSYFGRRSRGFSG